MSLFIGNVDNSYSYDKLERLFQNYGRCNFKHKGSYAFAEYEEERDAKVAKDKLNDKKIGEKRINIEWSRKSRYFKNERIITTRRRSRTPDRDEGRCYLCGSRNHYVKACK
jgi:RNA recognition motif-containing protein